MARAYGSDSVLLVKEQVAFETPATGNFRKVPFFSTSIGAEQGLVTEPRILGQGRGAPRPFRDVVNAGGDFVVPVDAENIGFWLKMFFGSPATTGTSDFTHVFKTEALTLPFFSAEVGHPKVPAYHMNTGISVTALEWSWARSGVPQMTVTCLSRDETVAGSTGGGSPAEYAYTPLNQYQGSLKRGGVAMGNIVSANMRVDNGSYPVENIRPDGLLDGVDPGPVSASGSVTVRYANRDFAELAQDGTAVDLEFGWVVDADTSLLIRMPEVYLPRVKHPVSGPAGVQATYNFTAAYNQGATATVSATLKNQVSAY